MLSPINSYGRQRWVHFLPGCTPNTVKEHNQGVQNSCSRKTCGVNSILWKTLLFKRTSRLKNCDSERQNASLDDKIYLMRRLT